MASSSTDPNPDTFYTGDPDPIIDSSDLSISNHHAEIHAKVEMLHDCVKRQINLNRVTNYTITEIDNIRDTIFANLERIIGPISTIRAQYMDLRGRYQNDINQYRIEKNDLEDEKQSIESDLEQLRFAYERLKMDYDNLNEEKNTAIDATIRNILAD